MLAHIRLATSAKRIDFVYVPLAQLTQKVQYVCGHYPHILTLFSIRDIVIFTADKGKKGGDSMPWVVWVALVGIFAAVVAAMKSAVKK
ncbi:MAG: hypothetical protein HYV78_00415 [Candidatus Wildermuthbacteria bacterium]|nr:hypothetical protein [Candidatus Wildermuthbacteria bacterium]